MPRKTEVSGPVEVIRKEVFKTDDEYIYENVYLSDGGVVQSLHPRHPAEPKEVLFERVGEMMLEAWYKAQARIKKEAEAPEEAPVPGLYQNSNHKKHSKKNRQWHIHAE